MSSKHLSDNWLGASESESVMSTFLIVGVSFVWARLATWFLVVDLPIYIRLWQDLNRLSQGSCVLAFSHV